jgi:hypothetical protein
MITSIKIRLNFERGSAFFVSSHLSNDILIILPLILISVSIAERGPITTQTAKRDILGNHNLLHSEKSMK